jgi:hypothetical protein
MVCGAVRAGSESCWGRFSADEPADYVRISRSQVSHLPYVTGAARQSAVHRSRATPDASRSQRPVRLSKIRSVSWYGKDAWPFPGLPVQRAEPRGNGGGNGVHGEQPAFPPFRAPASPGRRVAP